MIAFESVVSAMIIAILGHFLGAKSFWKLEITNAMDGTTFSLIPVTIRNNLKLLSTKSWHNL